MLLPFEVPTCFWNRNCENMRKWVETLKCNPSVHTFHSAALVQMYCKRMSRVRPATLK